LNFEFSEEQEEIRRTLRDFLADRAPLSKSREWMETAEGFDRDFWNAMAEELGLLGLVIPERFGGTGYGGVELTVVMEEMGRAMLCSPFFSTIGLAAQALIVVGDEDAQKAWLPSIASGDSIATLAVSEAAGRWDAEGVQMSASRVGEGYNLTGTKEFVTDGMFADLILVLARLDEQFGVFALEGDAKGLAREALPLLDSSRPLARLVFDSARAKLIGRPVPWSTIQLILDLACAALAAEQVGGAQSALEMAVAYAKDREQFGRPIGSFQAIKHKCADMLLRVEAARSAAYYAGWVANRALDESSSGEGARELRTVTSIAKADVSEAFVHVAEENLQIHGGLGFTWEQHAHLFLKRARSSLVLFGDPAYHRGLTAAELLD
jgi:alkylation response protein AidB-like acyl-CoA dehydrogenase